MSIKTKFFTFIFFLSILFNEGFALHITQPVIFDIQDYAQIPQNTHFASTVNIDVNNNLVTITIPSLGFSLPSAHSIIIPPQVDGNPPLFPVNFPGGGFVYTKSGFIPNPYKPPLAIGVQATVTSTPSAPGPGMIVVITQEGNIRFAAPPTSGIFPGGTSGFNGPGYYPIQQSGPFITNPVQISYPLVTTPFNPPANFPISEGHTQQIYVPFGVLLAQYGDTYFGDINNGFFGSYWIDNSAATQYPFNANGLTRMGTISYQNGQPIVQLQDPVVAISPPSGHSITQGGIAINPTNPNNIVVNALVDSNQALVFAYQLWRAVSNDGGKTWPIAGRIDGPAAGMGIPTNIAGDNNGLFDKFGNHWITNLSVHAEGNPNPPWLLTILVSSNGGQTYSIAGQFNPTLPPFNALSESYFDFNQLAFGGDGNGGSALYFVCDLIDKIAGTLTPCIGYFPVTGNGSIGTPQFTTISLGLTPAVLKDFCVGATPIVSDDGHIFINYEGETQNNLSTYRSFYLFTIPGGINGIASGALNGPYFLAQTNIDFAIEANPGIGTWYGSSNAKNIRGSNPGAAVRGLAYDNNKKVLYALVNDTNPIYSQNFSAYLLVSKDAGVTWSAPYFIKDNPLGNSFQASMTLDPGTGDLLITWYDSRNDQPANQYVEFFGAVVSSAQLNAIINTLN